jgi:starch synthase (maltosyl-transferring)
MAASSINAYHGRARVVIDRIVPSVDGGAFAYKHRAGTPLRIVAHAIADGHDHLDVLLCWRRLGDSDWQETPMADLGNDEFAAELPADQPAWMEYRVCAWADHFRNWHHGFIKKADAGDEKIAVELAIGAELVRLAASRAKAAARKVLTGWASFLADDSRDTGQRIALAREATFYDAVRAWPDRSLETASAPCLLSIERERAFFSTWYEFFPRSTATQPGVHGTFADAQRLLPEIADMGFDIVYLPPIHPIGRLHRKGRNNALVAEADDVGSPWAIGAAEGGHKSLHPELGDMQQLHAFISRCKELGMELAMDIAFQCAPDHPYVTEHPDWFKWRPDGSVQYAENPPKKYQDILPFDFETEDWQNLWLELKSVFDFWIGQGVRVFRVDNPHTKPLEFWRWCIAAIKQQHPDVIFLAEAFTRPKRKYRLAKAGFTQGYTYFTWRNEPAEMRAYLEELARTEVKDYFLPNFWPNTPDILHEDLQKGNRATFIGRYALAATLVGNTGIYGPAFEVMDSEPFPGKEEYNNNEKYQLKEWDRDQPGNIKAEISRINAIRKSNPALQGCGNVHFVDTENPRMLAWIRQTADRMNQMLIVVNFDWHHTSMGHLYLPLEVLGLQPDQDFEVCDLFDPRQPSYQWRGPANFVLLDPIRSPVHIFQVRF